MHMTTTYLRRFAGVFMFALVNLPLSAHAAQVVITITGTVWQAMDTTGVFACDEQPPAPLAGLPVLLTYTFDDTKGVQGVQNCFTGPCASWDCGNGVCGDWVDPGVTLSGTAVLQIGKCRFEFGTLPAARRVSTVRRQVPPAITGGEIFLQVDETYSGVRYNDGSYDGGNSFVQANVLPADYANPHGVPLTTDYRWWMPMSNSQLSRYPIQFSIGLSHSGVNHPILQAYGTIVPASIVVTRQETATP
jgi:hypothetical protein